MSRVLAHPAPIAPQGLRNRFWAIPVLVFRFRLLGILPLPVPVVSTGRPWSASAVAARRPLFYVSTLSTGTAVGDPGGQNPYKH